MILPLLRSSPVHNTNQMFQHSLNGVSSNLRSLILSNTTVVGRIFGILLMECNDCIFLTLLRSLFAPLLPRNQCLQGILVAGKTGFGSLGGLRVIEEMKKE